MAALALGGCNAYGLGQVPATQQSNSGNLGKLQIAVGTVNIGFDSNATGLNVVATFRQPNGLSATLLDEPTITGPAGFTNTGSSTNPYDPNNFSGSFSCKVGILGAGTDSGTASMSSDPQTTQSGYIAVHTFGRAGSVGAYGMQPFNSVQGGQAFYAGRLNSEDCNGGPSIKYPVYPEPFYLSQAAWSALQAQGLQSVPVYLGGPPAYPFFNDGSYPSGFAGFVQGFTAFDVPPALGQYTMSVKVPVSTGPAATYNASASLTNTSPLPNEPAPSWTSDGAGGGGGIVTVPSDPRIVETMVYIVDQTANNYYSVGPLPGSGALPYTLPDTEGPCTPVGCQKTHPGASLGAGDVVLVYAASFDYPMFEASPPKNRAEAPTISGANGQADITLSSVTVGHE